MNKLTDTQKNQIYQTIDLADKKIVLLDVLGLKNIPKDELNANIYCIDNDFKIIWQIDAEPTKFEVDSFTSIKIDEKKEIETRRFSGFEYKIDTLNGKAEIIGWNK
ncbi:MAG: hypothetical protein ACYC0J_09725 [Gammaproteobacteria bacterium]